MLRDLKLRTIQRNIDESNNIAVNFLIPALKESTVYDRSTGFFSVNVLLELFEGLLPFIKNNGRIRCITSVEVQEKDIDFFSAALERKVNIMKEQLESIIDTSLSLSEDELDKLDILTNLMAVDRLEFRFVCLDKGMYHEKIGFLQDDVGDTIYFTGSANESTYGAIFNRESVHLTFSWKDIDDDLTIQSEYRYFETLWNSHDENVEVFTFPEAVTNKLFKKYKISDTLDQACLKYEHSKKPESVVTKSGKTIRPYQEKAINLFVENDGHAFFEMATGTGKTFTAINAIKRFIEKKSDKFLVLILVPLVDLQNQWTSVLESEGISPYLVGGNGDTSDINDIINDFLTFDESQYAVCVYRSFFLKMAQLVSSIKTTQNIILVVDEAHNLSPNNMKLMPFNTPYRLGLSATPERYNQEETEKVMKYFLKPGETTFKYGLAEAISAGYLSHYDYYPITIHLTEAEMEKYNQFSKTIATLANIKKKTPQEEEKLTTCLNMRSQILKHAEGKFELLEDMVKSGNYDFSNSVIYCGRGGNIIENDASEKSIDRVIEILNQNADLMVSSFIDKTPNRKDVLQSFEEGIITTLVAIKCLDEGVDIPSLEKLYVLASDGAIRQTIQRRGRVLRICKETGKDKASIYDVIVLPPLNIIDGGINLVVTELSRYKAYASLADNIEELDIELKKLETQFGIQEEDYELCRAEILN